MDRKRIGKEAEYCAEQFLLRSKLKTIAKNFSSRFGEIDLIMTEGKTLVFIEVRQRKNLNFGGAAASVTWQKQQRIIKTAQCFLAENNQYSKYNCRFDVVAFEGDSPLTTPVWYKGAFGV